MQSTALVHEAYVRLVDPRQVKREWVLLARAWLRPELDGAGSGPD